MSFFRRLLAALVAATAALSPLVAQDANAPAAPAVVAPEELSAAYMLQPLDLLRVLVFQETDLAREVRVSQDFTIVLPLIGTVNLRGKSIRDAEELVRAAYDKDYLVNPQINITVVEYAPRTVNVIGMVNQPGAVRMPPEQKLTLLDAISRAGGFNRLANKKNVQLNRTHADGRVQTIEVNTDDIVAGRGGDALFVLPNDTIVVRERVL